MKPEPTGYKVIQKENLTYQIQTKYDLFHLNKWHDIGPEFDELEDAIHHEKFIQEMDLKEYKRCVKQGCSFPYND